MHATLEPDAQPTGQLMTLIEKTHIRARLVGPVVQVTILSDTLGEREADQLATETCDALAALGPRAIIDFASVRAIASAGLGALVRVHNNAKANGGAVAFYNCSPNLINGFKITRLNRLFKIAKDEAAAAKDVT